MSTRWIFIVILFALLYLFLYKPYAKKTEQNVINSEKLAVGMSLANALEIMGEPDNIRPNPHNKRIKMYFYRPPMFADAGIIFEVDTLTSKITEIIPFEAN